MHSGYFNRFLIVLVTKSQDIPLGGEYVELKPLAQRLHRGLQYAMKSREIGFDPSLKDMWEEQYAILNKERPGIVGAVTCRAVAHVRRLAAIYAVLDQQDTVKKSHLNAALEVWRYCDDSARYLFGDDTGNRLADKILEWLRRDGRIHSRTEINNFAGRNYSKEQIDDALDVLENMDLAVQVIPKRTEKRGRPPEQWRMK